MSGVGQLIRVDTNGAAPDLTPEPSQIFDAVWLGETTKSCFGQPATEPAEKGVGAERLHLNNKRLAFVHRHPGRLSDRETRVRLGQAAFIEGVAGFVNDGQDGGSAIVLDIACGDPYIRGRSTGKRMGGLIETGVVEVQSQPLGKLTAELLLRRDGKGSGGPYPGGLTA